MSSYEEPNKQAKELLATGLLSEKEVNGLISMRFVHHPEDREIPPQYLRLNAAVELAYEMHFTETEQQRKNVENALNKLPESKRKERLGALMEINREIDSKIYDILLLQIKKYELDENRRRDSFDLGGSSLF